MSTGGSTTALHFAYYPLTLLDNMSGRLSMVKAWVIEGILDADKIRSALDKVIIKWPMLAGRIESVEKRRYRIRIPLGSLPPYYIPYGFTTETSRLPLSHYLEIPVPVASKSPPVHLFVPKSREKIGSYQDYIIYDAPLTHWHITRFEEGGQAYSCLGIHYSHGLSDGVGFSTIMHAVVAELSGKEWAVPPYPTPGLNENKFEEFLSRELEKAHENAQIKPFPQFSFVGRRGMISYALRRLWRQWRYGVADWSFHIPYATHTKLVATTRKEAESAGLSDVKLSSGDVISAWLLKAVYSGDKNHNRIIGLGNVASLRGEWNGELANYPHNCFTALPYPTFSVQQTASLPLHQVAYTLATVRVESRIPDAVGLYHRLVEADKRKSKSYTFAVHENTQGHMLISNVSGARVSNLDWTGAGGGRNLCHYKYFPKQGLLKPIGIVGINGRVDNGDLVVNPIMDYKRGRKLESAIRELVRDFP